MSRRSVTKQLLEECFSTFSYPRLEKVTNEDDHGVDKRRNDERIDNNECYLPKRLTLNEAKLDFIRVDDDGMLRQVHATGEDRLPS